MRTERAPAAAPLALVQRQKEGQATAQESSGQTFFRPRAGVENPPAGGIHLFQSRVDEQILREQKRL
jgi:hypothetical protein